LPAQYRSRPSQCLPRARQGQRQQVIEISRLAGGRGFTCHRLILEVYGGTVHQAISPRALSVNEILRIVTGVIALS
jgi:hypothetical protein